MNDVAKERTFVWTDGSDTKYKNYQRGEPNDYGRGEDCVSMNFFKNTGGLWNDWPCNRKEKFICMKRAAGPPVPVLDAAKQCVGDKIYMQCEPKSDKVTLDAKLGRMWIKSAKDDKRAMMTCAMIKKDINGKQEIAKLPVMIDGAVPPMEYAFRSEKKTFKEA